VDFGFEIAIRARRDLLGIWKYIAQSDPAAATALCAELTETAESLRLLPQRHAVVRGRPGIRKLPHNAYIIFYKVHETEHIVEILRFWHAARDQRRLRLKEETTQPYQVAKLEA